MRAMHDADAHIVEPPDWLLPYADPAVRTRLESYYESWAAHRTFLDDARRKHADPDRASQMAGEALEMGCKALLIASACPKGHSPSHVALDPVWARAQEADIPIVLHVGGGGRLLDPSFFENGLPPIPDFHGGDG